MKRYRWILWVSLSLGSFGGLMSSLKAIGTHQIKGWWIAFEISASIVVGIAGCMMMLSILASPFIIAGIVKRRKQAKQEDAPHIRNRSDVAENRTATQFDAKQNGTGGAIL
jgi:hypothetical protein